MTRVFVSHSHEDNDYCRDFVETLRGLGVDVWYDEQSLGAGAIRTSIEEVLPGCDGFVVVLSPASVRSVWVSREINAALELEGTGRMKVLPVVAQPCSVPLLLSGYKRVEGISTPDGAARLAHRMLFLDAEPSTSSAIHVKVVQSPTDPDLDPFFELYATLFPVTDERATPEDMLRYIEESQAERSKPNPEYLEELVLVKSREQVVAFMNYTFYYSSRYVFVSYIGSIARDRSSSSVLGSLLAYFKQVMLENDCLAVVFEVESKRIKPKGETARIRRFRTYLRSYAHMVETNCYEVVFDYIQPHLMIDEVKETGGKMAELAAMIRRSPSTVKDLGIPNLLSLGFIPLRADFVSGNVISKQKLMSILRFVYRQVYGDSFTDDGEDDRKYKAYVDRLIRYYERTLPRFIPVRAEGTT